MSVAVPTETAGERKARGAFYTPPELARYLVEWAVRDDTRSILEPSSGDGVFLAAAAARLSELGGSRDLVGVELVANEADIAQAAAAQSGWMPRMVVADFFDQGPEDLGPFDAIVGNPPWIRYHSFTGKQRAKARSRAEAMGVKLTGLASSWAAFVVHACALLGSNGHLGMVVPAELLHAEYASGVRRLLLERFRSVRLIAFDHHVFGGAQVDALLLMASQDGERGLYFDRVRSMNELLSHVPSRRPQVDRWGSGLVNDDALAILEELERSVRFVRLGQLGAVDIGVVTGFNDYFVVSEQYVEAFALPRVALRPIVTRSDQLSTGAVTSELFESWRLGGRRVWLLALPRDGAGPPSTYQRVGERLSVPLRYKCRTRTPWWSVPLKPAPHLFLSYMAQYAPRLAVNSAGVLSTNLLHGVYLRDANQAGFIARAWRNPATELSCELEGRSYGGGVLKLETREAERVLVPSPWSADGPVFEDDELSVVTEALYQRRGGRVRRSTHNS